MANRCGLWTGAVLLGVVLGWGCFDAGGAYQTGGREPAWYVAAVRSTAAMARQFTFDATIEVLRKTGEGSTETVGVYDVKLAAAAPHKYLFWLVEKGNPRYLIVCDGVRTWAICPPANQYAEFDGVATALGADPAAAYAAGVEDEPADPLLGANLVVPILARLDAHAAVVVDLRRPGDDGSGLIRGDLPVLTVLSGRSASRRQSLAELVLDPDTLHVANLSWSVSSQQGEELRFARINVSFSRLQLGEQLPASHFSFDPTGMAKVRDLAVPGLDGASVLGKPAPDFAVQTPDRGSVHLSELRGRHVLLQLSDVECPACAKQEAVLAKVGQEYKDHGLVILQAGVADAAVHSLFHVHIVPTLILIDTNGTIVRYLPGARGAAEIAGLLQSAGIS